MITFKNTITNNIFTLPKDKAIILIKQTPEVFEVLSDVDKSLFENSDLVVSRDLSKSIYDLVVQDKETTPVLKEAKVAKKKTTKSKMATKVKRKGK